MNDPNYYDHDDFYGEQKSDKMRDFLSKIFGPDDENPCVIRNTGCRFTEKVCDYIHREWEVDVIQYSHEIQNQIMDMIDAMKAEGQNIPNTAAKIAMEVLPL